MGEVEKQNKGDDASKNEDYFDKIEEQCLINGRGWKARNLFDK